MGTPKEFENPKQCQKIHQPIGHWSILKIKPITRARFTVQYNARGAPCLEGESFFDIYTLFWQENGTKMFGFRGFISSEPKVPEVPRNVNPILPSTFKAFKNALLKERLEIPQWVAPPNHVKISLKCLPT